jgi:hypothetical protein
LYFVEVKRKEKLMRKRLINLMIMCFTVLFIFTSMGCSNTTTKVSTNKTFEQTIEEKLNNITHPKDNKISLSSNPYDYIKGADSSKDYEYIVSQGKKSLSYMLSRFANSDKSGLEEYIMAMACSEILKENPSSKNWATGRQWYDSYKLIETNNYLDENIYGNSSIRELLKLTKVQNIAYAGKFIDEKGTLNISLVYKTATNIAQKDLEERINNVNKEGLIKIINAQFSLSELQGANKILIENMKSLADKGLISIGIYENENRIIVTVKKINEEIKTELSNLVDMSLIILKEGLPISLT